MSREEILVAIRECAAELKRIPKLEDLRRMKKLLPWKVRRRFGTLADAVRAAGLKPQGSGHSLRHKELLLDWAKIARRLKQLPSLSLYQAHGRYSGTVFFNRFGAWSEVPPRFVALVRGHGIASKWKDVLAMIATRNRSQAAAAHRSSPSKQRADRPVYGAPLLCPGAAHEPTGESGVIYLFGALAQRLGFVKLRMQAGFPDCEAMREVGGGHWQRVRIEFEFSSGNFKKHGHRTDDCDMIVCWIHDWPACPKQLEVLELRKIVKQI